MAPPTRRDGKVPGQRLQEEFQREFMERKAWIDLRRAKTGEIVERLLVSIAERREVSELERWQNEAEVDALLLGLRRGLWQNSLPGTRLEDVDGLETLAASIEPDLSIVGDFIFYRTKVQDYVKTHPEIRDETGWGERDIDDEVLELQKTIDASDLRHLTPQQTIQIGVLLGYPEEAILGYAREREIVEAHGVPEPQAFWTRPNVWKEVLDQFSDDDMHILGALLTYREREHERIASLPRNEQIRARGTLRSKSYNRLRPHLARWYQEYLHLNTPDAEFLASKRRVELYLKHAPFYFADFAAYGEASPEELRLKYDTEELSNHL